MSELPKLLSRNKHVLWKEASDTLLGSESNMTLFSLLKFVVLCLGVFVCNRERIFRTLN